MFLEDTPFYEDSRVWRKNFVALANIAKDI